MTLRCRALARAGLTMAAAAAAALTFTAVASAHVTIKPDANAAGGWSKITVRVPNESDTAGTTKIRLDLPADTPFASVRVQPHPGWTAELTTEPLAEPAQTGDYTLDEAVTSVTWTAEKGVRIGPDEFDEFAISVGPLPEPGVYAFPAVQTYDDGTVVAWDMPPAENGDEPERPAPTLTVVEAATSSDDGGHHDVVDGDPGADEGEGEGTAAGDDGAADTLARGVGIGGVVIGAAGLGIGAAALRRRDA